MKIYKDGFEFEDVPETSKQENFLTIPLETIERFYMQAIGCTDRDRIVEGLRCLINQIKKSQSPKKKYIDVEKVIEFSQEILFPDMRSHESFCIREIKMFHDKIVAESKTLEELEET